MRTKGFNLYSRIIALFTSIVLTLAMLTCVLTVNTAHAVDEPTVIKVGWVTSPGLQDYDNDVFSGYTYEYLEEVAKYTGWSYEYVPGDLSTIQTKLQNGEVDIVGGLIKNATREAMFDFPEEGYGQSYISMYTIKTSPLEANDYDEYDGIKVGVIGSASANIEAFIAFAAEEGFTYSELVEYLDMDALREGILDGEVDVGVRGAFQADEAMKVLAEFSPVTIQFAVTKGNTEVVNGLTSAIGQIKITTPI